MNSWCQSLDAESAFKCSDINKINALLNLLDSTIASWPHDYEAAHNNVALSVLSNGDRIP
ncbi:MAG: hypothetical protein DID90_2727554352 [Candidatus Nitrotoga sp. LAW]|nr:MAG: hypothetical protein DID90_2727554352 [Candidatus Nitrotoga sp. LAW]